MNFKEHDQGVTHGEKAARLESDVINDGKTSTFTIGVSLYDDTTDENNYRDFSKAQKVTYDLFNAGETAVTVTTTPMKKVGGYAYASSQSAVVEPNTSAEITYVINRYELFYSIGIAGATHMNVSLKGVNVDAYIDNMRLHYIDDEFIEPQVEVGKDEIINFEKSYQTFAVTATGSILKAFVEADAENAAEGNRYLRVKRDGIADGVASYSDGKVIIPANYLNKIDFINRGKDAYIVYDYKVCWIGVPYWFGPRLVSSEFGGYANVTGGSLVADNEWHTFYVPLEYIPKGFDTLELIFQGGSYGEVCFDNFRIEYGLPENVGSQFVATGFVI